MHRWILLGILSAVLLGAGQPAFAQRGYRRGPAMTPYGPVQNPTLTPEWRMSGGNPMAYQQLMQQKMMLAQQKQMQQQYQALQKQQKAFDKWVKDQKAKKAKGQPTDPAFDQYEKMQQAQTDAALKTSTKPAAKTKTATPKKSATKASSASKPDSKAGDNTPFDN